MTRILSVALVTATAVLIGSGCSLSIGKTARSFDVHGTGSGATRAEATKAAREDASEQVRLMGYSEFELTPSGSASSATTGDHSEVNMGFRVTGAVKRDGHSHRHSSHDGDFCPICKQKKKCKCSEASAD